MFSLFAAIDVLDGVAARKAGCDTAARRVGDVLLDRVAIHLAALACCLVHDVGWPVWGLLLGRDVVQAALSVRYVMRTRTVVIGAHWHMAYGASMLLWGAGFIVAGTPILALTLLAVLVSAATFVDYVKRCADLERKFVLQKPAW
jgi:phosphatidylglycerophosphate synthase